MVPGHGECSARHAVWAGPPVSLVWRRPSCRRSRQRRISSAARTMSGNGRVTSSSCGGGTAPLARAKTRNGVTSGSCGRRCTGGTCGCCRRPGGRPGRRPSRRRQGRGVVRVIAGPTACQEPAALSRRRPGNRIRATGTCPSGRSPSRPTPASTPGRSRPGIYCRSPCSRPRDISMGRKFLVNHGRISPRGRPYATGDRMFLGLWPLSGGNRGT